jgi:predicted transcriptional regulator of viral defense system
MRYQQLKEQLGDFTVFSLADIRKVAPEFYLHQLVDWQKNGYIKKLRRGYYMFSDITLNEETLFLIANRLYAPSYVSFEMALSHYGLIPEGVYSVTSAAGKKTASFKTPIAQFSYRKIKPGLLFGYQLEKHKGQKYKIAEIEKAVLDYLYLNPKIIERADFYEWRFNSREFLEKASLTKLRQYAVAFKNKTFLVRLEELIELIKQAK